MIFDLKIYRDAEGDDKGILLEEHKAVDIELSDYPTEHAVATKDKVELAKITSCSDEMVAIQTDSIVLNGCIRPGDHKGEFGTWVLTLSEKSNA